MGGGKRKAEAISPELDSHHLLTTTQDSRKRRVTPVDLGKSHSVTGISGLSEGPRISPQACAVRLDFTFLTS